uniref:tRNA(Ile)-lysidine synthase n=1 Tax=Spermothamnion repens TaxID=31383 RepID=A0A4D6WYJ5_9FLOR|nr:tRNA Ile-lysidine synthetase [Spermothamnion repens]
MNYSFKTFFKKIIEKYSFHRLLISISGGQDSLYLIEIIEALKKNSILNNVTYIYIDHQWNIKSQKQIIQLSNYITQYKSQLKIYQIAKHSLSEHNSRLYRYQILIHYAIINNYQCILTAHSETDKIETFLNNLIKGTSLDGATSLKLHRQINQNLHILRPLIDINRISINWLCRKLYLPIWSDYTNYNYYTPRNRIRNELMPYLKKYFNLKTEKNFSKYISICNEENEYIKQNIIKAYLKSRHKYLIAINHKQIIKQHFIVQKRIIQLFIFHNCNIILNTDFIKQLIKLLSNKISQIIIKCQGISICINAKWLYIK